MEQLGHLLSNALERAYLARGLMCPEDLVSHHERGSDLQLASPKRSSPKTVWKLMNTFAVAALQVTSVNILNTTVIPRVNKDGVGEFQEV